MAQQVITGLNGSITLPDGLSQRLNSISINGGQALADISAYGDAGWISRIGLGIKDMSGTAAGFLTFNAAGTDPGFDSITTTGGSMTITLETGCTLTFPAVIGNIRVSHTYEGVAVVSFDWSKSIGAVTVAWDESGS